MDHLETTYKCLIPSFIPAITHPLTYARTMMLLGYEPFPPVRRFTLRNILHSNYQAYYYPSVFTYCRKLRQEVGLYGIFTIGLPANIIGSLVKSYSTNITMEYLTPDFYEKKTFFETDKGIRIFLISTGKCTVARVVGVVVSYPFQVIMIRQMSQFINGTRLYDYMLYAFPTILRNEGFLSFFSGLTPRLIGEVITVWLTACLAYFFNKYVFMDRIDPSLKKHTPIVTELMISGATHGLTVTSTVMAACDSTLSVIKNANSMGLFLSILSWFKRLNCTGSMSLFFDY
ncbi:unnamed protein product [Schistosoma rodhaini]|uniref:Mitochondrial carrier homolog 2 n=1 Tax=Schistosoma rodhaini TaxID=6188 RepID=A0AA85EPK4_9TREM|nr:unnamed protein product [Schistosoma rodhaini]CAH8681614.1 unnamed protein product [Schistosoma rodhaini]